MNKAGTSRGQFAPSLPLAAVFSLLVCLYGTVSAGAEKEKKPAEKVVVYYFNNATKGGEYGYYSYIIADSIASEIRNTGRYEVNTIPVTMEYVEPDASRDIFLRRLEFLTDRGREFDADYVIHGTYHIENQEIHIKTQIFDVRERKVKDIRETSREIGALLLVVIDKLSEKINTELQKSSVKPRPRVVRTKSPFVPVYRAMSGTSIGYMHGMGTLHGKWGDLYDKTEISSIYLTTGFPDMGPLKNSRFFTDGALTLKYDFFSCMSTESSEFTNLQVSAFSMYYSYHFRLSPRFSLALRAGPGAAFSTLKVEMDTGMGPPATIGSGKSTDFLMEAAAGGIFQFSPLHITAGFSCARIFYTDEPLTVSSLYFGIGLIL